MPCLMTSIFGDRNLEHVGNNSLCKQFFELCLFVIRMRTLFLRGYEVLFFWLITNTLII